MEICYDEKALKALSKALEVSKEHPVLMDRPTWGI